MSRDAADQIESEMRRLRQVAAEAQGIARDAVAQSKDLRSRLERDQALLAKEQGRWWPHPWQAALGLLGALIVSLVVLVIVESATGHWEIAAANAVILAALCLLIWIATRAKVPSDG